MTARGLLFESSCLSHVTITPLNTPTSCPHRHSETVGELPASSGRFSNERRRHTPDGGVLPASGTPAPAPAAPFVVADIAISARRRSARGSSERSVPGAKAEEGMGDDERDRHSRSRSCTSPRTRRAGKQIAGGRARAWSAWWSGPRAGARKRFCGFCCCCCRRWLWRWRVRSLGRGCS